MSTPGVLDGIVMRLVFGVSVQVQVIASFGTAGFKRVKSCHDQVCGF